MENKNLQELITAVEKADSANGLFLAVKNLAQAGQPSAIPTLIKVLAFNNPGASVAAVDGLIALGVQSVPYLLTQMDGYNYGARAWATRALAGIGDTRGLPLLVDAALNDFSLSVRRSAARGLGNLKFSDLPPAERTEAIQQVFTALVKVLKDPEWVVRYAAVVGLEKLAMAEATLRDKISQELIMLPQHESELVVRVRTERARQLVSG
ncbi:MAG: Phycocyanobilin lyase subunit beta [Chroococcopsis gigantea SAG 12.99]|jgi:phycocyanobilin lyase beta subunit|nr:HEAT repeat domain-containing protein [Chlorogloea purpurea SAG 13.99]MDV3000299.1 Phycocyanobilin lyase subunit beta [Chroococcopsis gigantea SAG 12.99]